MSNRGLVISILLLLVFFGGVNFLINGTLSSSPSSSLVNHGEANPNRVPSSLERAELVAELNEVIAEHPRILGARFTGSSSIGINLEDPVEVAFFMSEEGRAEYFSRFKNVQNFDPFIEDLEQAWNHVSEDDLARREALLEISAGLANFSRSEKLKKQILGEYDRFSQSIGRPEAQDYASRALQGYLDHEEDPVKRNQELAKRGIPILVIEPNKTNN